MQLRDRILEPHLRTAPASDIFILLLMHDISLSQKIALLQAKAKLSHFHFSCLKRYVVSVIIKNLGTL